MSDETTATLEEANAARLPLGYRDHCSKLLISLNKCRKETLYAPWSCEDERHSYEKCQYDDYKKRMKALQQKEKERLAASAE